MLKTWARRAVLLLLFLALVGGSLVVVFVGVAERSLSLAKPIHYEVRSGGSLKGVARDLERQGLIPSARMFELVTHWQGDAHRIHSGEYALSPGMSQRELADKLLSGDVVQYRLTLVEGWNILQVLDAVHSHPMLEQTLPPGDMDAVMPALGRPDLHPEGRFLPDTYSFPRGTTDVELLARAMTAMERALEEVWASRQLGLPLEGPEEMLNLAAIIEKETGLASERETIAGVFIRRMEKGMRLQTDPTIIYGLLGTDFDGRIRYRHLRDSGNPYNTYRHGGLPPTPIAMPGRAALEAAVNPKPGNELYFVSRNDGSHHFSATLAEHNRAVARYQLGQDPDAQ